MQLNPHHPERFWSHLGKAHFAARQYGEAVEAFMHLSVMDHVQHAFVAACYGWLGDDIGGLTPYGKVRALPPDFRPRRVSPATQHYVQESDLQHLSEGLVKAGVTGGSAAANGIAAQ